MILSRYKFLKLIIKPDEYKDELEWAPAVKRFF